MGAPNLLKEVCNSARALRSKRIKQTWRHHEILHAYSQPEQRQSFSAHWCSGTRPAARRRNPRATTALGFHPCFCPRYLAYRAQAARERHSRRDADSSRLCQGRVDILHVHGGRDGRQSPVRRIHRQPEQAGAAPDCTVSGSSTGARATHLPCPIRYSVWRAFSPRDVGASSPAPRSESTAGLHDRSCRGVAGPRLDWRRRSGAGTVNVFQKIFFRRLSLVNGAPARSCSKRQRRRRDSLLSCRISPRRPMPCFP